VSHDHKMSQRKRILLAIQTQYSGHLARGLVYYQILKDDYDICFTTIGGPPASWFLKEMDIEVRHFPGLYMIENSKGGIAHFRTLFSYFIRYYKLFYSRYRIAKLLKSFDPHLVISDFEPEVSRVSLRLSFPLVTIDAHRRIYLSKCPRPKIEFKDRWDNFCMKVGMFAMTTRSPLLDIAISFFPIETDKASQLLCPPLLRSEILDSQPSTGDYLLIYHNTQADKNEIIEQCKNFPTIVYGYNCAETYGQLRFKNFNGPEFISDLAGCKVYACRGGFESVAEALYFNKPIYLVPQSGQFEQTYNAYHASLFGAIVRTDFNYSEAFKSENKLQADKNWFVNGRLVFRQAIAKIIEQ